MNTIPVFRPPATRDHNAAPVKQFGAFRRWLYRVLDRPLIAEPRAERLQIKNPRLHLLLARKRRKS